MYNEYNKDAGILGLLNPSQVKGVSYGEVTRRDARFIAVMISLMTGLLTTLMFFVL